MRQAMIDFLQSHTEASRPPACPALGPIRCAVLYKTVVCGVRFSSVRRGCVLGAVGPVPDGQLAVLEALKAFSLSKGPAMFFLSLTTVTAAMWLSCLRAAARMLDVRYRVGTVILSCPVA